MSEAPVRICEHELLSGAATLGSAIDANVPVRFTPSNGSKWSLIGVNHLTAGFDRVVRIGVDAVEKEIDEAAGKSGLSESQMRFYKSLKNSVSALRIWHARYLEATKNTKPEIYKNLLQVPFGQPRSYYEAMQSLWFLFAFTRLCGHWSGIGRIDRFIGPYLKADLE